MVFLEAPDTLTSYCESHFLSAASQHDMIKCGLSPSTSTTSLASSAESNCGNAPEEAGSNGHTVDGHEAEEQLWEHRVSPEDTLVGLCLRYRCTAKELRQLNHFSSDDFQVREWLLVPAGRRRGQAPPKGLKSVCNSVNSGSSGCLASVRSFVRETGVCEGRAREWLRKANWDVEAAKWEWRLGGVPLQHGTRVAVSSSWGGGVEERRQADKPSRHSLVRRNSGLAGGIWRRQTTEQQQQQQQQQRGAHQAKRERQRRRQRRRRYGLSADSCGGLEEYMVELVALG